MRLEYDVAAGDFTRAGFASSSIKKALKQLGVSPAVVKRVVIAVYEAEVNIVAHANGGRITADIEPDGINVYGTWYSGCGEGDAERLLDCIEGGPRDGFRSRNGTSEHKGECGQPED